MWTPRTPIHTIVLTAAAAVSLLPGLNAQITGLDGPWLVAHTAEIDGDAWEVYEPLPDPLQGPGIVLSHRVGAEEQLVGNSRVNAEFRFTKDIAVETEPRRLLIDALVDGDLGIEDDGGYAKVTAIIRLAWLDPLNGDVQYSRYIETPVDKNRSWPGTTPVLEPRRRFRCLDPGLYRIEVIWSLTATMQAGVGADDAIAYFYNDGLRATFADDGPCTAQAVIPGSTQTASAGPCVPSYNPYAPGAPGTAATIAYRVPAAELAGTGSRIHDVAFAPCGNGRWQGEDVIVALGHLAATAPATVVLPTFGTSAASFGQVLNPGYLTDVQVVRTHGPFGWNAVQDRWSPLGLEADFTWNGVDDVILYVSYSGLDLSGWDGSLHGATWPAGGLALAAGFQAPQIVFGGGAAPTIQINPVPRPRLVMIQIPSYYTIVTAGGFRPGVLGGYTLLSFDACAPPPNGIFGLNPDATTAMILGVTPSPGNPLAWTIGTPGVFPAEPVYIPAPVTAAFSGLPMDALAVVLVQEASGLAIEVSDLERINWL